MKKRTKLERPLPKKRGLNEVDIVEISDEVRKAFQNDADLRDFSEMEKLISLGKGPNYRPSIFYNYSLSTGS
jgi:hypothetical protein